MKPPALLVLTTVAQRSQARRLARLALDARAAACATILPQAESHFTWQGRREKTGEYLILFKLPPSSYEALYALLTHHHPYDCPEIMAFPARQGHPAYLKWLQESTSTPPSCPKLKK